MTYDEFYDEVYKCYMAQEASMDYRLGQIYINMLCEVRPKIAEELYFNMLCEVRPKIAEELRGSMLDPFFKHRITQVVSDFVRERW